MGAYTVTTTPEQDRVLQWEADRRGITVDELVQGAAMKMIAERAGHFHDPREVLKRLGPAERARIPADIRLRLGI